MLSRVPRLGISRPCVSGTWMSEYKLLNCTATNTASCVWCVFTHHLLPTLLLFSQAACSSSVYTWLVYCTMLLLSMACAMTVPFVNVSICLSRFWTVSKVQRHLIKFVPFILTSHILLGLSLVCVF